MTRPLAIISLIALAAVYAPLAQAGSITIPGVGATFTVKVPSFKERRFKSVIKQQHDFSCGSAALATLLTYHYQQPISEKDVFEIMYARGDKAKIHERGFSLLDMKGYLESRDYRADGFRISLDKLRSVRVPAVALINTDGYLHFVVVKGIYGEQVLMGDPAQGLRVSSREKFESMWNGIFFLIRNQAKVAQKHFNNGQEWRMLAKAAPLDTAIRRGGLASFTLSLPTQGEF